MSNDLDVGGHASLLIIKIVFQNPLNTTIFSRSEKIMCILLGQHSTILLDKNEMHLPMHWS